MAGPTKDFLLDPGTSGFIAVPFSLATTELNALTTGSGIITSVNGTSGIFSQTNFVNGIVYEVYFTSGGVFTPTAGANIAGWWDKSIDGGSTFERITTSTAFPRPPDLLIPLDALQLNASDIRFGIIAPCPWPSAKLFILNSAGATLPATGNIIKAAPVGWGY